MGPGDRVHRPATACRRERCSTSPGLKSYWGNSLGKLSSLAIILILMSVLLGAVGQISLKYGVSHQDSLKSSHGMTSRIVGAVKSIFTPYIFLGFACYAVSSVIWLLILSQVPLSVAYPMISMGYVVVVCLSSLILHEKVPLTTVGGLILICGGVSLIGFASGK